MTRLILLGGFLGAGKTTVLLRAARMLTDKGYRVGYVTNDQGAELVDTALASEAQVPVVEIAGGCFCCRYPELLSALHALRDQAAPEVILAEPTGSCTDLAATVLKPLAAEGDWDFAPLSVLVDGSTRAGRFGADVKYLQEKQLEEAELLLINKIDRLSSGGRSRKEDELREGYPGRPLFLVSGNTGEGLEDWLEVSLGRRSADPDSLVIDYDRYARAEEALGWLNARGQIRSDQLCEMGPWIEGLAGGIARSLQEHGLAAAHLKILAQDDDNVCKGSLVEDLWTWDLPPSGLHVASGWEFLLNLRAGARPEFLRELLWNCLPENDAAPGSRFYITHLEAFAPLYPRPVHRIA